MARRRFKPGDGESGERGATIVEAALVFPLLFFVLITILEFGLAFKDSLSVGHGAREGARAGATFGNAIHANILVLQELEGVLGSAAVGVGTTVRIYDPVSGSGDNYTYQPGFGSGCNWNPCPDPDKPSPIYVVPTWNPTTRDVSAPFTGRIGVRVRFTHQWLTRIFATTSDFTKDVDFQLEPQVFDP